MIGDASSLERALGKAGLATQGFGDKMKAAGRTMTTHLTLPILAVAGVSTKMAVDFQTSMELLSTQAGVPQKAIAGLSKSVLALAGPTATAPDELSKGLYHLTSQGLRGAKSLEALQAAAQGAKMGQANLEDVTNALGAVLASKIAGVHSYRQAMGMLNATVGAGDMRMQDLADAMGTGLAASAAVAHVSLRQVGAALATLGDNNIRGAKAGTLLISTMRVLGHQSTAATAALQDLGVSSDLLQKKLSTTGLSGAIDYLHQRIDASGKSTAQIGSDLSEAFGGKQATGIKVLIDQVARFHTKLAAVDKGGAAFAANWTKYTHTAAYKMDRMGATMRAAGISIGDILLPVVSKLVNWIAKAAGWFEGLGGTTKKAILIFAGVAAAIGPALSVIGSLATVVAFVATGVGALVVGIGLFVGAIAAAVLWPGKLKAGLEKMGLSAHAAGRVVAGLQDVFKAVKAAGEYLVAAIRAHWTEISAIFSGAFDIIKTVVTAGISIIRGLWDEFGGTLVTVAKIAWNYIAASVRNGLEIVRGIIDVIGGLLHGDWGQVWKGIEEIVGGSLKQIWNEITTQVALLGAAASLVGSAILKGVLDPIAGLAKSVWGVMANVASAIRNAFGAAFDWLEVQAIKAALGIVEPFSHLPGLFGGWARDAKDALQAQLDQINANKAIQQVHELAVGLSQLDGMSVTANIRVLTSIDETISRAFGGPGKDFFGYPNTGGGPSTHPRGHKSAAQSPWTHHMHALGGIFTQPHIGMVAEAGAEAILPLTGPRAQRVATPLAQAIVQSTSTSSPLGGGGTLVIENHLEVGGTLMEKHVREVSIRNQRRGNRILVGPDRPGG